MCDGQGVPLAATLTPGQAHESKQAQMLTDQARFTRRRPRLICGDKGYSYPFVRTMLRRRRVCPLIPTRADQPVDPSFDHAAYKKRNVVERLVGWPKERRRSVTRFDKLDSSYMAFVTLAFVQRCMQMLKPESSDRT